MAQLNCLWFDDENSIVWVMCFTIRERIRYWAIELHLHPRGISWKYWLLNWEQSSTHVLNTEGEINEVKSSDFSGNRILFRKRRGGKGTFHLKPEMNESILSLSQTPAFGAAWKNCTLREKVIFSLLKKW